MAAPVVQETQAEVRREDPAFPPFNAQTFPSQLLWFVIVFVALYLLMARVALPRVGGIFEVRRSRISHDLDDAARMQKEAEAAGAAYEKTVADARARAQAVAQKTREDLAAASDTRRKDLEDSLNGKLAEAEQQIARTRTEALSNVSSIATDVATEIVRRLTGQTVPADKVAAAVVAVGTEGRGA